MRRSHRRFVFGLLGIAALALGAGVVALDALFEEEGARRIPSLVADTGCRSVLAIFAHPDDEILVAATLADAARRGCIVRTVTATRGEQGIPHDFPGDGADLGRLRERELRQSGTAIGIRSQELWGFPDGRLDDVGAGALLDSVSAAIRRHRPDLVITFDSVAGFTGHPDHRCIGEVAVRALRQSGDPVARPEGASAPRWIAQVVFPRRAAVLVPDAGLRRRLRAQPRADVAVQGNLRVKLRTMQIHRTQQRYFPPAWVRPLLYRFYDREHFSLVEVNPAP
jgi:LmbE family N-acetylglucosaminyl deacetylase